MCSIMGIEGYDVDVDTFKQGFDATVSRGPDMSKIIDVEGGYLAFHRLAIMGLHEEGMQPFELDDKYLVCNGEIYGFRPIKEELKKEATIITKKDNNHSGIVDVLKEIIK